MANVSKAKRRRTQPGMTRNGRVKYKSLTIEKLQTALEKAARPRDKDKIQRFINKRLATA